MLPKITGIEKRGLRRAGCLHGATTVNGCAAAVSAVDRLAKAPLAKHATSALSPQVPASNGYYSGIYRTCVGQPDPSFGLLSLKCYIG